MRKHYAEALLIGMAISAASALSAGDSGGAPSEPKVSIVVAPSLFPSKPNDLPQPLVQKLTEPRIGDFGVHYRKAVDFQIAGVIVSCIGLFVTGIMLDSNPKTAGYVGLGTGVAALLCVIGSLSESVEAAEAICPSPPSTPPTSDVQHLKKGWQLW